MKNRCLTDEEMTSYVDGVVGGGLRKKIEAHLAACPVCLHNVAELKELVSPEAGLSKPVPESALARAESRATTQTVIHVPRAAGLSSSPVSRRCSIFPLPARDPGLLADGLPALCPHHQGAEDQRPAAFLERLVELFLNANGGPVDYRTDYRGTYVLMEKIKIEESRVDVADPISDPAPGQDPPPVKRWDDSGWRSIHPSSR